MVAKTLLLSLVVRCGAIVTPRRLVTAGSGHTCGIRADNSLAECWGLNNVGQAGAGRWPPPSNIPVATVSPNVQYICFPAL